MFHFRIAILRLYIWFRSWKVCTAGPHLPKARSFNLGLRSPNHRKIAQKYKSATLLPETKYTGSENKLLQTVGIIQQDTQCKYNRDINARSRNHCCRGKAKSITYYKCVSIVSVIQLTKYMRHIVRRGLSGCTMFYHIIL